MIYKIFLNKTYFILLLLVISIFPENSISNTVNYEFIYFTQKKHGSYKKALITLQNWISHSTDPNLIEINLFRIQELLQHEDLTSQAITILKNLAQQKNITRNIYLNERIHSILLTMYLRNGKLDKANTIIKQHPYLDFYTSHSFKNNDINDFEKKHWPEKKHLPFNIATKNTSWVKASPDLTGEVDFNSLYDSKVKNKLFYLYQNIQVSKPGIHYLFIGKTGYTDIWLNNKKIFSNRIKHNYNNSQYIIKVHLGKGRHSIMVKTGDSQNKLLFSLKNVAEDKEI
jgi:hypothetical protein